MNIKKINELLEKYDENIKQTIIRILDEEEKKISLENPKNIKVELKKIIEEMVELDNQ